MSPPSLSLCDARRLAVQAQLLDGHAGLPEGKEGAAGAIDRLGYVQIDTISVVERAHHHALRTRCSDYAPWMLDELLAVDRRVFEYWGHAASYLPIRDFRYYLPRMQRSPTRERGQAWLTENRTVVDAVLDRIQAEGPLSSKDFHSSDQGRRGTWWDWKPAKMALEMLFSQGKLMVTARRNFQRIYDLTERVLPDTVDTNAPSDDEVHRFLVRRALDAYGVANQREIRMHIDGAGAAEIGNALASLLDEREIVQISIAGVDGQPDYTTPETLDRVGKLPDPERCVLLSPFDNLIIQRNRTERLFGFNYSLECYVPAAKRVHGYFVFPILHGDRFIGRLDPKADRKTKTLIVRKLGFEPAIARIADILPKLADTIADFARCNGCETVTFENLRPTSHQRALQRLVRLALAHTP